MPYYILPRRSIPSGKDVGLSFVKWMFAQKLKMGKGRKEEAKMIVVAVAKNLVTANSCSMMAQSSNYELRFYPSIAVVSLVRLAAILAIS